MPYRQLERLGGKYQKNKPAPIALPSLLCMANLVRNPLSEFHILVFVNGFHYIGDLFNLEKL